jgi:hypothetical protein
VKNMLPKHRLWVSSEGNNYILIKVTSGFEWLKLKNLKKQEKDVTEYCRYDMGAHFSYMRAWHNIPSNYEDNSAPLTDLRNSKQTCLFVVVSSVLRIVFSFVTDCTGKTELKSVQLSHINC